MISLVRDDGHVYHAATVTSPDIQPERAERLFALMDESFPRPLESAYQAYPIRLKRIVHYPDFVNGPNVPATMREFGRKVGNVSMLIAPMLWEGRGIGTIHLIRQPPRPFSDKEHALLATFADQAVIAIENVRLFNETKEALEQQRASAEVLSVISGSVADTAPVFNRILSSCGHLFGGLHMGVNLVGDDGAVHLGDYAGPNRAAFETIFPLPLSRASGTGTSILEGRVIHFPDVEGGADVPDYVRRGCALTGIRSIIFAPMLWEGRGIGAIFVGRDTAQPFAEKDVALLRTFADQAVIGIQNARLFNETRSALERQTATAEILKVIARSPTNVQPVLDAIVESARQLVGGFSATVQRLAGDTIHLAAYTATDAAGAEALHQFFPRPPSRCAAAPRSRSRTPRPTRASRRRCASWRERAAIAAPSTCRWSATDRRSA